MNTEEGSEDKIEVHGTKEGKLYIKPEDLFAQKKVHDVIKKVASKAEGDFEEACLLEIDKLNDQLKQRDETIKQLKEALREVLDYWESHEPPTYHNTAYYNARKLLS